jgi:hypothetical protein
MGVNAVMSYSAVEWWAKTGLDNKIKLAANEQRNIDRFVFTATPPQMLEFSSPAVNEKHMPGLRFCQRHFLSRSLNSSVRAGRDYDSAIGISGCVQSALVFVGLCAVETCFAPGPTS